MALRAALDDQRRSRRSPPPRPVVESGQRYDGHDRVEHPPHPTHRAPRVTQRRRITGRIERHGRGERRADRVRAYQRRPRRQTSAVSRLARTVRPMPNQVAVLGELLPDDLRHDATARSARRRARPAASMPAPQEQHGLVGQRRRRERSDSAVHETGCWRVAPLMSELLLRANEVPRQRYRAREQLVDRRLHTARALRCRVIVQGPCRESQLQLRRSRRR